MIFGYIAVVTLNNDMDPSSNTQDETIRRLNEAIEAKDAELKALTKKLERSERLLQKTDKYNEDLLEQIKSLSTSLESRRKTQKGVDVETQTEWVDTEEAVKENSWLTQSENQQMSIADCVRAAATEAIQQTNFVFDETSGYYYDSATGYYYDPVNSLYYHSDSGTYYVLDPETQTYKFHSQVDLSQFVATPNAEEVEDEVETKRKHKKEKRDKHQKEKHDRHKKEKEKQKHRSKKKRKKDKRSKDDLGSDKRSSSKKKSTDDIEVIELDDSPDEEAFEEGECSSSSEEESISENDVEDNVNHILPCIRCMVEKSTVDKISEGTLFIITCSGATIGREKTNDICLPDIQISKVHAEVKYNETDKHYTVVDVGSQNGTFLNGSRLSEPKQTSELFVLSHDDVLVFPTVTLRCHIHIGHETCDQCEPGLVQAVLELEKPKATVILSKDEKEKLRRQELKQIKRKFGLQAASYENNLAESDGNYNDRAQKRRKVKGSSNPYEKTETASIDQAIQGDNKGFKMLKKMGWSEGTGLGKSQTGIVEPISLKSNTISATSR